MLVTQTDYTRWQNMYGQRNSGVQEQVATTIPEAGQVTGGQGFAFGSGNTGGDRSSLASSEREKSFLEEAFERTLNHRLGIDQKKMDQLKEEIEKTETAIDAIKQKPHSAEQQKELQALEDKLKKLEEALEELVRQAAERANEDKKPEQKINELVARYQSVASFL